MKNVLIGLAALLVVLIAVVATRPSTFKLERCETIAARPELVFAELDDFHRWEAWSPWAKLDPSMKTTYTGPARGVGAVYAWNGNDQVGEGRMTIEAVEPAKSVKIKLEFLEPFAATNDTGFTLTPEGSGTKVTWAMSGQNNFVAKAMSLFMSMEKMVGPDFEKGLASLKTVAEASEKARVEEEAAAAAAKAAAEAAAAAAAAAEAVAPTAP